MGALNDGLAEGNGRVRGVIHKIWVVDRHEHEFIKDMVVVEGEGLQARKKALVEEAEAVIALPGGPGTFDELWEVACEKSLGFVDRLLPIVVLNVGGYYDGSIQQLERAHQDGILYLPPRDLLHFADTPEAALAFCVSEAERCRREREAAGDGRGGKAKAAPVVAGRANTVAEVEAMRVVTRGPLQRLLRGWGAPLAAGALLGFVVARATAAGAIT
ncbi:unnamed protein product [Phaeothamnion confervicola]